MVEQDLNPDCVIPGRALNHHCIVPLKTKTNTLPASWTSQSSAQYGPWAKSGTLSVFTKEALLEYNHIRLFTYCVCFNTTVAELSGVAETMALKM